MAKVDYTHKPSAFESEIHPSHKTSFYALCISPLQGALCRIRHQVRKRMPKHPLTIAVLLSFRLRKEGNAYGKEFIYTNVKADQSKGEN